MPQASFSVDVNPKVLQWARETSGLTTSYVAERLGISEHTLHQWEAGRKSPPWQTLRKLATYYQRPLAALLLAESPHDPEVPPDFRTLPSNRRELSSRTLLAIRTARWLQSRAIEMRRDLHMKRLFPAKRIQLSQKPEKVAGEYRKTLGIKFAEQAEWKTRHEAYGHWRESLEDYGIVVFQFPFPVDEVRGFSLFDPVCPVIVVNESDDPLARVFTLIHEYGHLLLQKPGICLPQESTMPGDTNVEPYCNRFAAAVLIPDDAVHAWNIPPAKQKHLLDAQLKELANRFWVSKYVALFRLTGIGVIARPVSNAIEKQWKTKDAARVPPARMPRTGGPSRINTCRRQRGGAFISLVQESEKRGLITTHDAVTYLGVKLVDLKKLESTR
jgi:Zn-dependent peptidase ImmA (M78 family)/DNA-binding XRE family transcriptional regulator